MVCAPYWMCLGVILIPYTNVTPDQIDHRGSCSSNIGRDPSQCLFVCKHVSSNEVTTVSDTDDHSCGGLKVWLKNPALLSQIYNPFKTYQQINVWCGFFFSPLWKLIVSETVLCFPSSGSELYFRAISFWWNFSPVRNESHKTYTSIRFG